MSPTQIVLTAVAADLIITAAVLYWLMRKRGLIGSIGVDLEKIRGFTDSVRELTRDYLRANYGGDPASLPGVLDELLAQLEVKAQEQQLNLTRDALKMILMRAIAAQETIPAREAMTALKKVA